MTKLAWLTDIHLDHIRGGDDAVSKKIAKLRQPNVDGYVITGDISNSQQLRKHLNMLADGFEQPVNFVLGNHDVWYSSVASVQQIVDDIACSSERLRYLPGAGISINPPQSDVCLIGVDGWYDGLNGAGKDSRFRLNDWAFIEEYRIHQPNAKWGHFDMDSVMEVTAKLAANAVEQLKPSMEWAIKNHSTVVVLTHIPPWEECHYHEGKIGDPDAQPWYTSRTMANYLEGIAESNPDVGFLILCGHTHGAADVKIRPNLRCIVGSSKYGEPKVQQIFEF